MSVGFRQPWNKGGGYSLPGKRVVRGMPGWWNELPKGFPDYEKLAQAYAVLLTNQAGLIRRKQLDLRAGELVNGKLPPEMTKEELDFLLKANKEILEARSLMLKEKVETARQLKAERKRAGNPFVDPRGEVVEGDLGWEEDGRQEARA